MQGPIDEASVPMKSYVIDSRILGVTMRRKNGIRTMPVPAVEEANPVLPPIPPLPPPLPPPLLPLPPQEDEDIPEAERPRLHAPTSISTAANGVTTDPCDNTPADPVISAAPLPSVSTSRAASRYWNGEEDTKLTDAVKKYGKKWVAVASLVPGRTSEQCSARWVGALNPVNGSKGKPRHTWKPEEDAKLTEAVKKHGNNWVAVAALLPGRRGAQCRQRWTQKLDPINRKEGKSCHISWKPEEDAELVEAVKKYGKDWVAVAALFSGRTNKVCRQRWVNHLDPDRVSSTMEVGYIGGEEALV
jgi:hypothetical protein